MQYHAPGWKITGFQIRLHSCPLSVEFLPDSLKGLRIFCTIEGEIYKYLPIFLCGTLSLNSSIISTNWKSTALVCSASKTLLTPF